MTRLLLLAAALGVAGCSLTGDCHFGETSAVEAVGALEADGRSVTSDTLTVAVVSSGDAIGGRVPPFLDVRPGLLTPTVTADAFVRLDYRLDGEGFGRNASAPQFTMAVRGDTAYVAVEGQFDLVRQVCSPSEAIVRVDIQSVGAPAGVRAVRIVQVSPDVLSTATVQALTRRISSASPTFV